MAKNYLVNYTWHSGESFEGIQTKEAEVEIDPNDMPNWKHDFEEENFDGSYCSINWVKEIEEKNKNE